MLSGNEILKLEEFYHIFSFEPNFQVVAKLDGHTKLRLLRNLWKKIKLCLFNIGMSLPMV